MLGTAGCQRRAVHPSAKADRFFAAAATGDIPVMQYWFRHDPAIINATANGIPASKGGATALSCAVSGMDGCGANLPSIQWLLHHGADPNVDPYLLLALVRQKRFDAVIALVQAGANPDPVITLGSKTGPLLILEQQEYRDFLSHFLRCRIIMWYLKSAAMKWDAKHRTARSPKALTVQIRHTGV
jgi:hypothetical protein